jgi:hypothetical protein
MPADRKSWERLGRLLIDRRIQLSTRYRTRSTFAEEKSMNWRLLHDVELAKRSTFKPETLRAVESAYELAPGSVGRTLAGGPLEYARVPQLAPAPVPQPAPGGDDAWADRFSGLFESSDQKDHELLGILARARDAEGRPLSWRRKFEIASRYLAEFAGENPGDGEAGTALPVVPR